jgi:F-type H+-transporting ATPase subunit delta
MMRSASRAAAEALRPHKRAAFERQATVEDLMGLAAEFYAAAELLVGQARLRRAVGNPGSAPDGRAALITGLLAGKLSQPAIDVVEAAVRERWSSPWDLTDALETAGDDALFAVAEREGKLSTIEDELFWIERILNAESRLTTLLDEAPIDADRRVALLNRVLDERVDHVTKALLDHGVRSQRKRSITLAIDDLLEEAAARRAESTARVVSAVELSAQQLQRLTSALGQVYGKAMTVRTATDPAVRGGLVVRVGNEVIDGSVATRLLTARSALAS